MTKSFVAGIRGDVMKGVGVVLALVMLSACASTGSATGSGSDVEGAAEKPLTEAARDALLTQLIEQGDRLVYVGDAEAALMQYMEALRLSESAELLVRVGGAYRLNGDVRRASNALRRALVLDGEQVSAWEQLGLIYLGEGKLKEAQNYLSRAIALDDKRWRSHNAMGVAADLRRDSKAARLHYGDAIALNDQSAMLLTNYGYSFYLGAEYDVAKHYFKQALAINSEYERAWANLALLEARIGDYGQSLQLLAKVREDHVAHNDIGYVALLNRDYDDAERLFTRATELSPIYYRAAYENLTQLRSVAWSEDNLGVQTPVLPSDLGLNSAPSAIDERNANLLPVRSEITRSVTEDHQTFGISSELDDTDAVANEDSFAGNRLEEPLPSGVRILKAAKTEPLETAERQVDAVVGGVESPLVTSQEPKGSANQLSTALSLDQIAELNGQVKPEDSAENADTFQRTSDDSEALKLEGGLSPQPPAPREDSLGSIEVRSGPESTGQAAIGM